MENTVKKYKCVKDYHPIIHKNDGTIGPTDEPIVLKGDILIQMYINDDRFKSINNPDLALEECTLKKYKDCFVFVYKM
jgi:hypothetical protein